MDIAVLRLAFTRHVLDTLARSDGYLQDSERDFVQDVVPDAAMQAAGLMDEFGVLLPEYDAAHQQALRRLPVELSLEERLAVLGSFFHLCLIDGHLDRSEGSLLYEAARRLGVGSSEFDTFLSSQDDVGDVELDAPLGGATS